MRDGARQGQAELPAARREAEGLLRAGAHQGSEAVAAHQAQGPVRGGRRRHGAAAARCSPASTVEDLKVVPAHRMPAARLVPAGKTEPMPAKLAPMLARDRATRRSSARDWMWEPKLDGYRVLAFIDGDRVKLRSRRGLDLAGDFPRLAAELAQQAAGTHDPRRRDRRVRRGGKPSFGALQDRAQLKTEREIAAADRETPVAFFCFDLLHFAGIDLRRRAVSRSAPLPRAVPAAVAARAARARGRGRRGAATRRRSRPASRA